MWVASGGQRGLDISRSSFPSYSDQMEEEPVWVSATGRKWRRNGYGGGRLTFVECPLCRKHWIRHFAFFIFLAARAGGAGSRYPRYFTCGEVVWGHLA